MKSQKLIGRATVLMLAALTFLLIASTGWSATYYIDYQSGNDSNNGTSTSTPFKHSPGDPRATSNANITLSPGDTVVFKGGVTYSFDAFVTDYIEANASGTSGNVITYISGHVHSPIWGSGRAVIDGTNADLSYPNHTGVFSLLNYSYLTVEGFEVKNQPSVNSDVVGLLTWYGASGGNIIIDNNKIHDSFGGGIVIQGEWGAQTHSIAQTPSGFIIRNNDITLTNYHGLMIRSGLNDVLITNNTFDLNGVEVYAGNALGDSIALAYDRIGGGSIQTNVIIRGNDFNDTAKANPNYVPSKGHILIQQDTTGTIIEDNYFHGEPLFGIAITGPQTNITFRNNVFHDFVTKYMGIIRFSTDQGATITHSGINIFNNTFVSDVGDQSGGIIYFDDGNSTEQPQFFNVDIKNNIIDALDDITYNYLVYIRYAYRMGAGPTVQLSTLDIDNNIYNSKMPRPFYAEGTEYTFADWKTYLSNGGVSGADANSTFGQVAFVDEANDNFMLSSGAAKALDKGVDLSSKGFSDDENGESRPQGLAWDIGAYEYEYENVAPAKMNTLKIVQDK